MHLQGSRRARSRPSALGLVALAIAACSAPDRARPLASAPGKPTTAVVVREPEKLRSIETGERDASGRPVRAACVSCHSQRPARAEPPESASELVEFHRGLIVRHGPLRCAACHAAGRADALHLADGRLIEMTDALSLCAQCHGPQHRDYSHGSHGGMTGYWDRSRGVRARNHCVDCHDPHSPHIPTMSPVAGPRDRFAPAPPPRGHE